MQRQEFFLTWLLCPHRLCPIPRYPGKPFHSPPPPDPDINHVHASSIRKREGVVSPCAPSNTTVESVGKTTVPLNVPELPNHPPLLKPGPGLTAYKRQSTQINLHGISLVMTALLHGKSWFTFDFPIHHQAFVTPMYAITTHQHLHGHIMSHQLSEGVGTSSHCRTLYLSSIHKLHIPATGPSPKER